MKILLLSPYPQRLSGVIANYGDTIITTEQRVDDNSPETQGPDLIVSHGYRHIIGGPILERFQKRIVNLHISYLPWNAGADPNFWSLFDETPCGVTLHWIDKGIDSGEIIVQRRLEFTDNKTLASTYEELQTSLIQLFDETWPLIRMEKALSRIQIGPGSYHSSRDKEPFFSQLSRGWDTSVAEIVALGRAHRAHVG